MYSRYVMLCAIATAALPAAADVVTFDSFTEGEFFSVVTEHGVSFANLDQRLPGRPGPAPFVIESAANMLWRETGFTAPNALGFGTYAPGEPVMFGRIGSFDIIPAGPSARIQLHFFQYGPFAGRTIDLTLSRLGAVVGELSFAAGAGEGLHHHIFDFDGPTFDLATISIGPEPTSFIFALVDTITIDDAMPCPADWNNSGNVDSADFFAFLGDFFAANADFNADKVTDSRDFFDFLALYFAGCW